MKSRKSWATEAGVLLAAGLVALLACSGPARAAEPAERIVRIELEPPALVLTNQRDSRHALVTGIRADGQRVDLTGRAAYATEGDAIRLDANAHVHPVQPGKAVVRVRAAGHTARLPVTVKSVENPRVSFVREVMPILSRAGCNQGICHGAAAGRNGFKLSLRAYDPHFDYTSLVEDLSGRRFNRAQPAQSLMLLKPTQGVPHAGGLRFDTDSDEYHVIQQWIAEGALFDDTAARATRLEVLPAEPTLQNPGEVQRVIAIAHYRDGSTRDVTSDAAYASSVPDVATISHWGQATAERRGETFLLTRYEGNFATTPLIVLGSRKGFQWAPQPQLNFIDRHVDAKLRKIKAIPAPLADDAEFLRRVYLDLAGLPPTAEQVRAFLADGSPTGEKRARVIDELLASPDYVEHWTNKWADLLQCNRKYLGEKGVWVFRNWIRAQVSQNRPYNEFVTELLTASGPTYSQPAAWYFKVIENPDTATENVTQLFLGIRFACNKCHDHPFERWTRGQYYNFAAFFGQVGVKREGDGAALIYDRGAGEVTHPVDGRVMAPEPPYAYDAMDMSGDTRRERFVSWLASPENPYFARSYVNRIWSYFLGRGIIDPVDDIRNSNPPTNPALLDALAQDFIDSGFDTQHLIRTICSSRAYQASIQTNRWNEDDDVNFSHARPRRLAAEQLLDAIAQATGSALKFPGLPAGTRAAELPDSTVNRGGFLDLFGRPQRESPCECERSSEISLSQALNLTNGETVADSIIDPEGRVARLMKKNPTDTEIVEEIYLATLCRLPRDVERRASLAHLQASPTRTEGAQDLMWALINSASFLFNR